MIKKLIILSVMAAGLNAYAQDISSNVEIISRSLISLNDQATDDEVIQLIQSYSADYSTCTIMEAPGAPSSMETYLMCGASERVILSRFSAYDVLHVLLDAGFKNAQSQKTNISGMKLTALKVQR